MATIANQQEAMALSSRRLAMGLATAVAAAVLSKIMVGVTKDWFLKAGLSGVDLNKGEAGKKQGPIPEALGLVSGIIFFMGGTTLVGLIPNDEVREREDVLAALVSVSFMLLLGFADDVLNLRWRYKLVLPLFAAIPSVTVYDGPTKLPIPELMEKIIGTADLGDVYRLALLVLALFSGNAVNIYAGVNGIEIGQSVLAAGAIAIRAIMKGEEAPVLVILPFIGASIGLFMHNKYPSKCFVGDTFTYSAGMVLSVAAYIGGFPVELLFYMLPEFINFLISLPQLIGIIPCPRHRLPKFNQETGKLEAVKNHLTLINFYLRIRGPLTEKRLCQELLVIQAIWECVALVLAALGLYDWLEPR